MILSVCPGLDLWSRSFEDEGYFVVRAGDPIFGQRGIEDCHPPPGQFEGVIAGIPCQPFSVARNGKTLPSRMPDLTHQVERVILEAQPDWWLTENVYGAPVPDVEGYYTDNRILFAWDLGVRQRRPRRFCVGAKERTLLLWPSGERHSDPWPTACGVGMWQSRAISEGRGMWADSGGRRGTPWAELMEAFGLPADWVAPALTQKAARLAVANSVPLPVAGSLAKMIKRSFGVGKV